MSSIVTSRARAVADLADRLILATVEIAAPPERVFRAISSREIVDWWVAPGIFDTREWSGELRVGGRWQASGEVRGEPYALEGEFLEIDPPRKLVHTWQRAGTPGAPTTVTYVLDAVDGGTRVTLRHKGFPPGMQIATTSLGWETSFTRLAEILGNEKGAGLRASA